jgi:hypothetical protein
VEHVNRLRIGALSVALLISVVQCWWSDGAQAQSVQSAPRIAVVLAGPSPHSGEVMNSTDHRQRIMTQDQQSFGPLTPYIGVWTGTGIDTVPDGKGGSTRTPFIQQVTLEAIPQLTYGSQTVRALRYSCLDWAIDDKSQPATMVPVFEENGYFIWIPEKDSIVLQVSNPRGLSILASGRPKPDGSFTVTTQGSDDGVLVTGYLHSFANAVGYEASVELLNSETLRYSNDTLLKLPDGSIFHQTDVTTLKRY